MFWTDKRQPGSTKSQQPARRLGLETLESRLVPSASPAPVLVVLPNTDFYDHDYGDTRLALEQPGVEVKVASSTCELAWPHACSGQGADGGFVRPDVALADVDAADYSAIVFVGGWGASSYQYAFSGTYANAAYTGDPKASDDVFIDGKIITAENYESAYHLGAVAARILADSV